MNAKATHYAAKCTPRKARLLRPLVKGKTAAAAVALLSAERRAGSVATIKLIKSAMAQLPRELAANAVVADLVVNEGPRRTTYMPRAQGRASPVTKKTSHLTVRLALA
jgi:large subunit ribosomal protein L22